MSPSNSRTPSPKTHDSHDFSFSMRGVNSGVKNFSGDAWSSKYEPPQ